MYCSKCGNQLPENSVFCSFCGENQSANSISQTTQQSSAIHGPTVKKKKTWPWILAAAVVAVVIILIATNGGGKTVGTGHSASSPNITVEQMKQDLVENDVYIVTAWWEDLYHLEFKDFKFSSFEITKTLTEDSTVYYYVNISGKSYANINAPFIITYQKFKEGWAFTGIRYNGSI